MAPPHSTRLCPPPHSTSLCLVVYLALRNSMLNNSYLRQFVSSGRVCTQHGPCDELWFLLRVLPFAFVSCLPSLHHLASGGLWRSSKVLLRHAQPNRRHAQPNRPCRYPHAGSQRGVVSVRYMRFGRPSGRRFRLDVGCALTAAL